MSSSVDSSPRVAGLRVEDESIQVWLDDGRAMAVPLAWYPRLCHGSDAERNNWEPIGGGTAIRWPDLDEDISTEGLIAGPAHSRPGDGEPRRVAGLRVEDESIQVWLDDGRAVAVPLAWYPRLCHGSDAERNNWEPIGGGTAIRWPDLDEDISTEGLIAGPSLERALTLGRWLLAREQGRGVTGPEIDEWRRKHRAPAPVL